MLKLNFELVIMWKCITCSPWDHVMDGGGSGACLTKQVRLMVDPKLMNSSGPPKISVSGSWQRKIQIFIFTRAKTIS